MIACDTGVVQIVQLFFVSRALKKRTAVWMSAGACDVQCRKVFHLPGRRFSAAGDEGETVDVLPLIVLRLFEALFCGEQVVDFGFGMVMGRLCAPFAVFGAASRFGIDDRTHVKLARCALYGNLVRSGIKRFTIGGIRPSQAAWSGDIIYRLPIPGLSVRLIVMV